MPNPALLLCDTDVLIQLFLANELRPLKELKRIFGVQPAVVAEVADIELRWNGRYRARFVGETEKALRSGVLERLDPAAFQGYLGGAPVGSSWAQFQTLGVEYARHVQRGEAYTFAAAISLGMPAISNDFRAIETLRGMGWLFRAQCCDVSIFSRSRINPGCSIWHHVKLSGTHYFTPLNTSRRLSARLRFKRAFPDFAHDSSPPSRDRLNWQRDLTKLWNSSVDSILSRTLYPVVDDGRHPLPPSKSA